MNAPPVKPVSEATRPARKRKTSADGVPLIVSVSTPVTPLSNASMVESPFPKVLMRYASEPLPPSSVSTAPMPFAELGLARSPLTVMESLFAWPFTKVGPAIVSMSKTSLPAPPFTVVVPAIVERIVNVSAPLPRSTWTSSKPL